MIGTVTTPTTEYQDDTTSPNTTYHYVVRTTAGGWVSENSAEASETTPGSLCV